MKKKLLIVGALALTTACAGTPPLPITSEPTTIGVLSSFPPERLRPSTEMTVRTFDERGSESVEVAGLMCKITSDELTGSLVTPGIVNVPKFDQSGSFADRGRPDQLLVACEGNGLRGNTSVVAQSKDLVTATNAGLIGAVLSTAVSATIANTAAWQLPDSVAVGVR